MNWKFDFFFPPKEIRIMNINGSFFTVKIILWQFYVFQNENKFNNYFKNGI